MLRSLLVLQIVWATATPHNLGKEKSSRNESDFAVLDRITEATRPLLGVTITG
jgi:hypothetical protein